MAKKKSKGTIVIPMDKEESGGGRIRVPEGDYILKCVKVENATSKKSGDPMLVWHWEFAEGKYAGREIVDRTVLTPKALWKVRQILEAMGKTVPTKAFNLNVKALVGTEVGATITDGEPYGDNNRISSEVGEYIDPDVVRGNDVDDEDEEDEDEEDEEEEDEDEEDEDEEEDDDDDEDLEEMDLEDL